MKVIIINELPAELSAKQAEAVFGGYRHKTFHDYTLYDFIGTS